MATATETAEVRGLTSDADNIPQREPGLYSDREIPFDEYLRLPYISNTRLGQAARSMAHFRAAEQEPPADPTPDQIIGSLVHAGKLEPLAVAERYVVMPDMAKGIVRADGSPYASVRATSQYKDRVGEFEEAHKDKTIVEQEWYDNMLGMLASLKRSSKARELIEGDGLSEVTIIWGCPYTGLRCKARIDWLKRVEHSFTDLKTTADARDFQRSISKWRYHRQCGLYHIGLLALTGERYRPGIVAAEKGSPYGVRSAYLSEESLRAGVSEAEEQLRKIATARETGAYPGYEDPDEWNVEPWALRNREEVVELTIGGEKMKVR